MRVGLLAIVLVVLLVAAAFGYLLQQNNALRRDLARTVEVISEKDKHTALALGEVKRSFELFNEKIEGIKTPTGPVIIRTVEAKTPTTGAPGANGLGRPMISGSQVDLARAGATERIVVGLRAGSLINCPTPGLEANNVELLRDPTGRLLSPTSCVTKITDTVRLREEPPASQRRSPSRWKAIAAVSQKGVGFGGAFEVVRVWRLSADAVITVYPTVGFGPGLSYGITDNLSAGAAYLYQGGTWSPAGYVSLRF